jgi:hypothetical protein
MSKLFWRFVIWRLKRHFGKRCLSPDYKEFDGDAFYIFEKLADGKYHSICWDNRKVLDINADGRCFKCAGYQVVDYIQKKMIEI